MDNASKFRSLIYVAGILGSGAALWLTAHGYATYDSASGVLDIQPFNVAQVATQLVSWVGNGLALMAVWKGWGRK